MPVTFLKIIQPYLLRYLAKRVAEHLEKRHERRLAEADGETPEPSEIADYSPPTAGFSTGDVFWFSLSGILVGSALGYGLAYLMKEED